MENQREIPRNLLKRIGVPDAVITKSKINQEYYEAIYNKLQKQGKDWVEANITEPWQLIALSGQANLFTLDLIANVDRSGVEFVEYAAWSGIPDALKKVNALCPGVFYRDTWQLLSDTRSRPDELLHYAAASGVPEQLACALNLRVDMHPAREKGHGWMLPMTTMPFNSKLKNEQLLCVNNGLNQSIYFNPEFTSISEDIEAPGFNKVKASKLRNEAMRTVIEQFIPRLNRWHNNPSDGEKTAILEAFTSASIATIPGISTSEQALVIFEQMLANKTQQPLRQIIDIIDNEIKRRLPVKVLPEVTAQYRYSQRPAFSETTTSKLSLLYELKAIFVASDEPNGLRLNLRVWEEKNRASIDDKKITFFNNVSQTRIAVSAIEEIMTRWIGAPASEPPLPPLRVSDL